MPGLCRIGAPPRPLIARPYGWAPHLAHIFIQLGHAEKEAGYLLSACSSYGKAFEAKPDDVTPLILLGNLQIRLGKHSHATQSFRQALRVDPSHPALGEALFSLLSTGYAKQANLLAAFERDLESLHAEDGLAAAFRAALQASKSTEQKRGMTPALLYDVTDLVRFFFWSRTLTGIQRVQVELVRAADSDRPTTLLFFNHGRGEWSQLLRSEFDEIVATLAEPTLPVRRVQFTRDTIKFKLLLRDPFEFCDYDSLIDLGGSWEFSNFFLALRAVRERARVRYTVFVHDLIPIVFPGRHVGGLGPRFLAWVAGIANHADTFLANSQSTRRDLIKVAGGLGIPIEESLIEVVPLNAMLPSNERNLGRRIDRPKGPFVLFVSTVEPRKGHVTAFDAWTKLIEREGTDAPQLICVGKMGWLYEPILAKIRENRALKERVTILSDVSDVDLVALYKTCLFTLYPSFYEGWGLPVTESLAFGKVPVLANTSSLPEAGQDFAVYFEAGNSDALCDAICKLAFRPYYREGLERRIAAKYRPRTWHAIERQVAVAASGATYAHPCHIK